MTRLGRWLFNGIAGLSLVLCVATAAFWIRSYFRLDDISHKGQWHIHNFSSVRGRAFIQWGWSTQDELKRAYRSLRPRRIRLGYGSQRRDFGGRAHVSRMEIRRL